MKRSGIVTLLAVAVGAGCESPTAGGGSGARDVVGQYVLAECRETADTPCTVTDPSGILREVNGSMLDIGTGCGTCDMDGRFAWGVSVYDDPEHASTSHFLWATGEYTWDGIELVLTDESGRTKRRTGILSPTLTISDGTREWSFGKLVAFPLPGA